MTGTTVRPLAAQVSGKERPWKKGAAALLVVLTPLLPGTEEEWEMIDGYGWNMVDVSDQEPWNTLR